MIDTTNHEEEQEPVRKVLKSLPKVDASEDFELRLSGRLSKQEAHLRSRWRVPAYAISLIGILTAGVFAYISLIRTGDTPIQTPPQSTPPAVSRQTSTVPTSRDESRQSRTDLSGSASHASSESSGTSKVSFREKPTVSPASESLQEELSRQGLLKEVGGTGARPSAPGVMPEMQFFRVIPQSPFGIDSAVMADSMMKDSLRRLEEYKGKTRGLK